MGSEEQATATLSCCNGYTSFKTAFATIRFRTPRNLKRYIDIREWDNGYIVVDAEYEGFSSPMEEYIDLIPILQNLYFDPVAFLQPVKEVHVA